MVQVEEYRCSSGVCTLALGLPPGEGSGRGMERDGETWHIRDGYLDRIRYLRRGLGVRKRYLVRFA